VPLTAGVVERYLDAVASHDWETLRACVSDDVVRIGPYGDVYAGREPYVRFLADLMPTLRGYAMDVAAVTYVDGGRRAFAELTETVTIEDEPVITPELLVFTIDGSDRITRVEIFTRRSGGSP
jgi:ketosteroid isomerase-like protein